MKSELTPIGDVCQFVSGGTPSKKNEEYFQGTIPWITSADIDSDVVASARSYITEQAIQSSATKLVKKGTILLVTRTGVGKVAQAGMDLCFSQDITGIISDPTKLLEKYLVYFLKTKTAYFNSLQRGATIQGITREVVESLNVPLPPIEEQKHIVAILDKADAIRKKRQETIRLADEFLRSVFLEMFGDPVRNEKGWEIEVLCNVSDSRLGKMRDEKQITGKYLKEYLGNSNIRWFNFDFSNLLKMDFDEDEQRKYSLEYGDLLVCEGGEIGRCAIWKNERYDCYFQKAIHRVRVDRRKLLPEYLQYVFWFYSKLGGFKDVSSESTIAHLTGEKLRTLRLPVPDLKIQEKFAYIVNAMEMKRTIYEKSHNSLERIFSSINYNVFKC